MSAPPPYSQPSYQPGYQAGYQPQPAYHQPQAGYQPQPNYGTYQPVPASTATTVVIAQPTATQVKIVEKKPDNYLGLSIFTLLCCCWLFGLIALIYSLQVDSAYSSGDRLGASSASRSAKTWNIVGIIWGAVSIAIVVVVNVIWIPVVLVANAADDTTYYY